MTQDNTYSNQNDLVVPNLDNVPEDDSAEPLDAGIDHEASEEEVEESLRETEGGE